MENKNELNPDWVSAKYEVTYMHFNRMPRGLSRKRRRHWYRQIHRAESQHAFWKHINHARNYSNLKSLVSLYRS